MQPKHSLHIGAILSKNWCCYSRAEERGLLGEFSFDGTTALAAIAHLYDPAAEGDGALTLAEFLASRFGGRPAIGDRTRFGAVELIVRDMQGDAVTQVGVELDPLPSIGGAPGSGLSIGGADDRRA